MKAIMYDSFQGPLSVKEIPIPSPKPDGVVIAVKATGLCRSDWHGWMGHDPDISLPHIPGHELAGIIHAVGKQVKKYKIGDRVTVPFVCGCGTCPQCLEGQEHICDHQSQPGFTHWGSFAEYVEIHRADINLVKLPEEITYVAAASLGCRFITAFRAVTVQGKLKPGQWIAVHGCGGVGQSCIMIGKAFGAKVIAIDINDKTLRVAKELGADKLINGKESSDLIAEIKTYSHGGAHLSIDALGSSETCFNSISCLRKRGKHIQVGLMTEDHMNTIVPMSKVLADELEIIGSHGMQAHKYPKMLEMILDGTLEPSRLIEKTISLEEAVKALPAMGQFQQKGMYIIDRF